MALTYIVNPLEGFIKSTKNIFITLGYARAAAELARMGYYDEAKYLMAVRLQQEKD